MAKTKTPTKAPPAGKSLDAFRDAHAKAHIIPRKIRAGLDELGESWEYELEFMRRCGLASFDLAAFRDQFAEHIVDVQSGRNAKRVYCGTKAFAAKLRGMV